MRRFLIVVLAIALIGFYSAPLLATSGPTVGHPMNSVFLTTETQNVIPAGKEIYGYTVFSAGGSGSFAFYDLKAITSSATTADIIDEGGEASANDSTTVWYPKPLVTDNGLSVALVACYITIYYQK